MKKGLLARPHRLTAFSKKESGRVNVEHKEGGGNYDDCVARAEREGEPTSATFITKRGGKYVTPASSSRGGKGKKERGAGPPARESGGGGGRGGGWEFLSTFSRIKVRSSPSFLLASTHTPTIVQRKRERDYLSSLPLPHFHLA